MKDKHEKGFALVLSLVLMIVMSLMGGALIIISSGDHASNNESDNYQQTFYVAETGLLEGERALLNEYMGPLQSGGTRDRTKRNLPTNDTTKFDGTLNIMNYKTGSRGPSNAPTEFTLTFGGDPSIYSYVFNNNICFESFRDLAEIDFYVSKDHNNQTLARSYNFGRLLDKSFANNGTDEEKEEAKRLSFYYYEYFITRIGSAPFKGSGSSIKKTATDTSADGMAYRIYACGIRNGQGIDPMVVPLESVVVLPK